MITMMTIRHRFKLVHLAAVLTVIAVILALCATAFISPVWADEGNGDEGEQTVQLARINVTIEAKTRRYMVTNIGERWQINKHPLIIGPKGQQVALQDMPVPCDVEILYYPQANSVKKAYRIDIKRIAQGAHTRFSDKVED